MHDHSPYTPPSAPLQDSEIDLRPAGRWRLFFWLNLLLTALSLLVLPFIEELSPFDYADLLFTVLMVPGFYGFCYGKRIGRVLLWRYFFYAALAETIVFTAILPTIGVPRYATTEVDAWISIEIGYAALILWALYQYAYLQPHIWNRH